MDDMSFTGASNIKEREREIKREREKEITEEDIIQGKDELIFQAGFRTFIGRPIFSEANLNCDKHKMERFLLEGRFSMATVFGPVTYLPCPVLIYRKRLDNSLHLLASGSLAGVDTDRIVLKKVLLTGIPVRVRKRSAVIKHLFHTPEDVRWFKPAELSTKHGLRGHIKEPLGTRGLFKAVFSGPITQNDTIVLPLYKRVFPKFPSISSYYFSQEREREKGREGEEVNEQEKNIQNRLVICT